jgi:hypothetical protein
MESIGYDPIVNQTFVEDLYRKMRARQASLVTLQVHVGAWDDRYKDYGMVGPPRHLLGHWRCKVNVEGREKCEGRTGYNSYWSLAEDW